MDLKKLLECVTAGFVRTRTKEAEEARDVAIADIALMIAALDGMVRPEELAAYRWIAGRCPGLSAAARRRHLDAAVRKAGHLLLMAQIADYTNDDLLDAFGVAAGEVLPKGFVGFSQTDIRRAFALWVSAAIADGDFSDLEHRAVACLRERFGAQNLIDLNFLETVERLLRSLACTEQRAEAERELDQLVVFAPDERGIDSTREKLV